MDEGNVRTTEEPSYYMGTSWTKVDCIGGDKFRKASVEFFAGRRSDVWRPNLRGETEGVHLVNYGVASTYEVGRRLVLVVRGTVVWVMKVVWVMDGK
uniref:Uncharacterized protein n=1 Tax=Compsopogon caeruleus TaxID=31354 RepID=A0A7S1XGR6_9RHOD